MARWWSCLPVFSNGDNLLQEFCCDIFTDFCSSVELVNSSMVGRYEKVYKEKNRTVFLNMGEMMQLERVVKNEQVFGYVDLSELPSPISVRFAS